MSKQRKETKTPPKLNVKLPKGYKIVAGGFVNVFHFEKAGAVIEGVVTEIKRKVKTKFGKQDVMILETKKGKFSIWGSRGLDALFEVAKVKDEVFIRFDGFADKKKKGQNPMKLFTTAIK